MKYEYHSLRAGTVNMYIISDGEKGILIDGGNAGKINNVINKLGSIELLPVNIDLLILTHTHFDHVGSLPDLKKLTPAKILVHSSEVDNLKQGYAPYPKGTRAFTRFVSDMGNKFAKRFGKYKPINPDIIIDDEFDLNEFGFYGKIVHTPGHSKGSLSVVFEGECAFVGDTLYGSLINSVYPPFANDTKLLMQSWKKLLDYKCKRYYPGHGRSISWDKLNNTYHKQIQKLEELSIA